VPTEFVITQPYAWSLASAIARATAGMHARAVQDRTM